MTHIPNTSQLHTSNIHNRDKRADSVWSLLCIPIYGNSSNLFQVLFRCLSKTTTTTTMMTMGSLSRQSLLTSFDSFGRITHQFTTNQHNNNINNNNNCSPSANQSRPPLNESPGLLRPFSIGNCQWPSFKRKM